jgi:hypothetical protein
VRGGTAVETECDQFLSVDGSAEDTHTICHDWSLKITRAGIGQRGGALPQNENPEKNR